MERIGKQKYMGRRFADSWIYEGLFSNNQMNGYGRFIDQNGIFIGKFENGRKNGVGMENGKRGIWYKGRK